MNDYHESIIRMSHGFFTGGNPTSGEIRDYIERMKNVYPDIQLDEAYLYRKLEAIHSVQIGEMRALDDAVDHEEWFNSSTGDGLRRKIDWHFWPHYRDYMAIGKGWPEALTASIDSQSNQILSRLEDPSRAGEWDRRGMGMGSVQSGKTANYTALIAKAADAGYKFFVVLAGVHDSLRSQTQARLNEEFLGYDLDRVQKMTGGEKRIGVRKHFPDHNTVYTLTSSNQKGDFSKLIASQSGIFPRNDSPPIILVIKKNVSILRNLISWIPSVIGQTNLGGRKVIREIPLMVIDDECDHASINTKNPDRDEDGKIIEEWNPTTTNRLIRELLNLFEKCSYIGYTATPYANIFINKDDSHPKYGEDLFPKSFIVSLPQPSNYMGPEKVFGLDQDPNNDLETAGPLPLVRLVDDAKDIIPNGHKKDLSVTELPDSLKTAIKCFLLSCAARRIRGSGSVHNSMLIHITRYTAVQNQVKLLVEKELAECVSRIMSRDNLSDLRELWEEDYRSTTLTMSERGFHDSQLSSWLKIEESLGMIVRNIRVKVLNGTVRDFLDYKDVEVAVNNRRLAGENIPWEDRGLSVIAIGGDKLSRGLTLEGLTVSYYLRASTLYDTLMQMGRWFGYREGYADLCRIFTTDELASSYRFIAMATKELRDEVDYMSELKLTPSEFGLKIRDHPGRLAVTSVGKLRDSQKVSLSYSGKLVSTVVFDPRHSSRNKGALIKLVKSIGRDPDVPRVGEGSLLWEGVPSALVIEFLAAYRTQDLAKVVVDPKALAKYIEKQNTQNELTEWYVVLVSKEKGREGDLTHDVQLAGYKITTVTRKAHSVSADKISIGTLLNPPDESKDLSHAEKIRALRFDGGMPDNELSENVLPSGKAIRHVRPKERGLLIVYLPSGRADMPYGVEGEEVVGFCISFPRSNTATPIDYLANVVYQDEEVHYT